tara:strand:+ start:3055 stop:3396 length:342 start_codon:yes stop_codon:yes gene_type:complete
MAEEGGWRAASEVKPDITDNREIITTHSFDLDADPAQIVWAKRDLTVDERKGVLIAAAKQTFQNVVDAETAKQLDDDDSTTYDASAVSTAQTTLTNRLAAINAATTHDDVDAL